MPASEVSFGVTLNSGSLIDAVDTEDLIETKALKGSNGEVAKVHTFNPTFKGSVKGHGVCTVAVGVGDPGVSSITGGVTVINSFKNMEKNDDFDGWEYSFENYPNATSL
jgi:hypothetical protein